MSAQRDTHALERAARRNWRVFTYEELLNLGYTRSKIATMVARGQLHQRYRGIYVYGHPDLPWQGDFLAAQYAAGPGAYLTHNSALACHRLWRPYTREIHVSTPVNRRSQSSEVTHQQVHVHRTRTPPQPDELRSDNKLRFAALPRLLLEFAPASNVKQLSNLITKAVQQDKLDHALMRAVLERYPRHPGRQRVEAAYGGYLKVPRSKSELEAVFDRARAKRPHITEPLRNHYVTAGGISWEIDRYWPEHGLGVEVDGRNYHQALADRDKDEKKRAKLLTIGIQTLSFSDWRIEYSEEDCLDDLEGAIAALTARDARRAA